MLKILLQKQWLEFKARLTPPPDKNGKQKRRMSSGVILALLAFSYCAFGFGVYGMSMALGTAFFALDLGWLYYAVMGILAVGVGVFGDVFTTANVLYRAKDNDLLLSLPIRPRTLLLSRMVQVFLMALLWSGVIWIPVCIWTWTNVSTGALASVLMVLLYFVLAMLVLVLSSVLGWVVSLIASRLKNKSVATAILTVTLLGVYYFVYFKFSSILSQIASMGEELAAGLRTYVYPFYLLGRGAMGEIRPFAAVTAGTVLLFVITLTVLSATFLRIVTKKTGVRKSRYKGSAKRRGGADRALLSKELKRVAGSSVYLMNGFLGALIAPALGVLSIVKSADILTALAPVSSIISREILTTLSVLFVISMDAPAAASVSMEGTKYIWVLKSMPVDSSAVLRAKMRMQFIPNVIAALIASVLFGIGFKLNVWQILVMALCVTVVCRMLAEIDLMLNLLKPNLNWSNEAVPVKSDFPIFLGLFGGWILMVVLLGPGLYFGQFTGGIVYLLMVTALCAGVSILLSRWRNTKGVARWEEL